MIPARALRFLLFLWAFLTGVVGVCSGDVVISEFMAVNGSTLRDGDGNPSDWIEIHNTSASDVDLTGWFLTDDAGDLRKWPFPAVSIRGNDYVIVFASGQQVDDYVDPLGYLHTNFRLSRNDAEPLDSLLLVMPDGVTVAHGYRDYPEQRENVSYGLAQQMEFTTLVREGADAVALIPDGPVDNWTEKDFDDSGWPLRGATGVGYENDTGYESLINLDVGAMRGLNTSVYIRIGFEVTDPTVFDLMTLRMKYDDGFIAYLNGGRISDANPPATPSWNSQASTGHEASTTVYDDFDTTPFISLLQPGENVLAIHGLNRPLTSSDFLILPELIAVDLGDVQQATPMYLTKPTPWGQNATGVLGYVSDVRFSVDRGFFTDPFDVVIRTATEDAAIYYTLNGSKPTPETGIPYGGPIPISGTTILRAAAFKAGYQPSKIGTQTYLFLEDVLKQDGAGFPNTWGHAGADYEMDPDVVTAYRDTIIDDLKSVPSVSLALNRDDFFAAGGVGIYPSGEGSPRATSFELIDPHDAREFQIDCSVEITGGTSTNRWKIDKLSMRLRFKEPYGPTKLRYPLFGEEGADRFDTLILDARLNQCWAYGGSSDPVWQRDHAQYTRDQYAPDLQNVLGGYGPRGMAVHLYVCGLYWGLYWLHERPDESFAAVYFGGDRDDYHVLKHNMSEVVHGSNSDYLAMIQLAAAGLSGNAQYEQIQQYLDVPNFIDYILVNFFVGNADWAHQNWYATRNVVDPSGRWRYHSWDSEHILKNLYENVTGRDNAGGPTAVHQDLCANAEYRLLFADHVHKHFFNGGALTPEGAVAAYQKLLSEVDRAVVGESARWGDNQRPDLPYTRDVEWVAERDRLLYDYFPLRTGLVLEQLKARGLYPSVAAPVFSQHGGSFPKGFSLTMKGSGTVFYTLDGTDPREYGTGWPAGTLYTGPVILERTALVKARATSGGAWSALNEALFVLNAPSTLRVTELMYHSRTPSGAESSAGRTADDFDFIELRNTGDEAIGLAGIRFTDGVSFDFTVSPKHALAPGEYILVVKNLAAFRDRYPNWASLNIAGEFKYPAQSLADGGERLTLEDGLGRTVLSFTYDDEWYVNADGLGYSLVAVNERAPSDAWGRKTGWRPSANIDGSPGEDDPVLPEIPAVVINEALTHTTPPAKDAIELFNPGAGPAPIGGWFLTDDSMEPRKFRIPHGTEVSPGQYLVFDEDDFNADPSSPTAFLLSSLGEEVYLYSADAEGNLTGYVHGFRFGAAEEGMTFGRYVISTGEDHFVPQVAATLNDRNAGPKVGPVVINEIMFDPLPMEGTNSVILEYLELRNVSSQDVPLFDSETPENTWRLAGGVEYSFPPNATIPGGACALVVSFDPGTDAERAKAFRFRYKFGEDVQMFGPYAGRLENLGERVVLLKAGRPKQPPDPDAGVVPYVAVDQVDYSNAPPWPTGADGTGESLQRILPWAYGNDPINWQVAPPTPGRDNAGSSVEDADGDGMPDEWEHVIVNFDPGDEIDTVLKVRPDDDFDRDGASNLCEYQAGTSPVDKDSDGDGYADGDEVTDSQSDPLNAGSTPPDNDRDFVSDRNDPDDDNDGYSDDDELTGSQSDPLDAASTPPDYDGDKVSDLNDWDDDNDGVGDSVDVFPFDPTEWADNDDDGIGDNRDPDDDNDGYSDVDELTNGQSDPKDSASTPPDNDLDMVSDVNDYDDDNDGMPDSWEVQFPGLDPMSDDAADDNDSDGQSNYAEYVAGTDPADAESVFAVTELVVNAASRRIAWSSAPGKLYRVWHSFDMTVWTAVSDLIPREEGGTTSWTDTVTEEASEGYYRVEVLQ